MATVIEAIETIVGLFQGSAIWLLIGAVVAYSVWADRRFDRRQQLGLCSRCGRGTGTITPSGTDLRMCTRCAAVTTRNHRLGFYVFLGMAVLGGLSVVIGTLSDISHGHALSWQYLLFFVGAVGLPLLVALSIRWIITRR
jgi:hypothetical protein